MKSLLKRGLTAVILFSLFSMILPAAAMAIPTTSLDLTTTSATAIYVGEDFSLDVYANNVTDVVDTVDEVLAFDFNLTAPLPGLTYLGAFINGNFLDGSTGLNVRGDSNLTTTGVSILLARLFFTANSADTYSLGITSAPNNSTGLLTRHHGWLDMTTTLNGITVQDRGASTVPEPSTLLLLGTGLIAAAVIGRVRHKGE